MEDEGYKKEEMILIVGSGKELNSHTELIAKLKEQYEDMKIVLLDMGAAGVKGATAGTALAEAIKMLPLLDCKDVKIIGTNFNNLENIVIDSLAYPEFKNFEEHCYDESDYIPKKVWKKFKKNLEKINSSLKPKSQKEIWCNKWNKKIKRKL